MKQPPVRAATALLVAAGLMVPALARSRATFEYAEDELAYTLNPLHESSMAETRLNELLFEPLFGPGYDYLPQPRLAESSELASDAQSVVIRLRQDVQWSDGQPFTAEDVKFTIEAYQNPGTNSPDRRRVSFISGTEIVDPHTIRISFHTPQPDPLELFYFKIIPAHRFESTSVQRDHPFWYQPTGTGPYVVSGQEVGTWSLSTNENAFRGPAIPNVKVREMPDKNQQVSSLGYGYIHAMILVPTQYVPEVERSRAADLIPYQSKNWWYLGFNHRNQSLGSTQVRNAIARAINVEEALDLIGEGDRISGPFVVSSKYYNTDVPLVANDADGAAGLMTEAGYTRGDSYFEQGGEPLSLRLFYRAGLGEAGQTVALNVQGQLRRFGIRVEDPQALDKAVWQEKVIGSHDFDLVLSSWSFDKYENIYDIFHSTGTQNWTGFNVSEVDSLLDRATQETDPASKIALLQQLHQQLNGDQPCVFLWSLRAYSGVRRQVENHFIQPFYYFTQFPDWRLAE